MERMLWCCFQEQKTSSESCSPSSREPWTSPTPSLRRPASSSSPNWWSCGVRKQTEFRLLIFFPSVFLSFYVSLCSDQTCRRERRHGGFPRLHLQTHRPRMFPGSSQTDLWPLRRSDSPGKFLHQSPAYKHTILTISQQHSAPLFFVFQTLSECAVTLKMIHLKRVKT